MAKTVSNTELMTQKAREDLTAGIPVVTKQLREWAETSTGTRISDATADAAFYAARREVMEAAYAAGSPVYVTHPLPDPSNGGEWTAHATTDEALILRSESWMTQQTVTRLNTLVSEQKFWLRHIKGGTRGKVMRELTSQMAVTHTAGVTYFEKLVDAALASSVTIKPRSWSHPTMGSGKAV